VTPIVESYKDVYAKEDTGTDLYFHFSSLDEPGKSISLFVCALFCVKRGLPSPRCIGVLRRFLTVFFIVHRSGNLQSITNVLEVVIQSGDVTDLLTLTFNPHKSTFALSICQLVPY